MLRFSLFGINSFLWYSLSGKQRLTFRVHIENQDYNDIQKNNEADTDSSIDNHGDSDGYGKKKKNNCCKSSVKCSNLANLLSLPKKI